MRMLQLNFNPLHLVTARYRQRLTEAGVMPILDSDFARATGIVT